MSLHAHALPPIPADTVRIAQKVFRRKNNRYLVIGDQIGPLFDDVDFSDLYATDGAPAVAPNLLALVVIFQRLEDLSDHAMADAVRARIDLKYALHLALDDMGFDGSLLSDFRERLLQHAAGLRLFERLLARLNELGLLAGSDQQRTDGTYLLAATRTLSRLELLAETLRNALEALGAQEPAWLIGVAQPHWYERYRRPWTSWRLPKKPELREQLAFEIAADGYHLLAALAGPGAPGKAASLPEVQTCQLVWAQQLQRQAGQITWRPREQLPPGALRIATPHDPAVRGAQHGAHSWEGYSVHLTETCAPDHPQLITDVTVVPATTPDDQVLPGVQERLIDRDLPPGAGHWVDAGYTDTQNLIDSATRQIPLVAPVAADPSWQAHLPDGYAADRFAVDWQAHTATCPEGQTSVSWREYQPHAGAPQILIRFAQAACAACPARPRCTRDVAGRQLQLSPDAEALRTARAYQRTAAFQQQYARRAGVEGTISVAVRSHGLRRTHYIGLAKSHLQALLTACAINLARAASWLVGQRPATTRAPGLPCLAHLAV
jgi:transposase